MSDWDAKRGLYGYVKVGRQALLWKLEGLSEYDVRRPLVPTGTNLLGLAKHLASVQAGYLGEVFGRPFPEPMPWFDDDAEPNADLWAAPDESREQILGLYRRSAEHADATVEALPLDAEGHVEWWPPEHRDVTLHQILVHLCAETYRHAGHADIVRELIDGSVGYRESNDNLPEADPGWWASYRERLEAAARES